VAPRVKVVKKKAKSKRKGDGKAASKAEGKMRKARQR
jgi:hypothetical protein